MVSGPLRRLKEVFGSAFSHRLVREYLLRVYQDHSNFVHRRFHQHVGHRRLSVHRGGNTINVLRRRVRVVHGRSGNHSLYLVSHLWGLRGFHVVTMVLSHYQLVRGRSLQLRSGGKYGHRALLLARARYEGQPIPRLMRSASFRYLVRALASFFL